MYIYLSSLSRSENLHIRINHGELGKLNWKTAMLWLRMNESYFFIRGLNRQIVLLDKFLADVAIALFGVCLFEMPANTIVNRFSVMS